MEDEELEVETPTVDASGTVDVPSITADRAAYGGGVSGTAVGVSLPSVEATSAGDSEENAGVTSLPGRTATTIMPKTITAAIIPPARS